MTSQIVRPSVRQPGPADEIGVRSRRSAALFIAGVGLLTLIFYSVAYRGPGPAIANPNPVGPYAEQGVPRPHPSVFGFEYWPQLFEGVSFVAFLGLWVLGLRQTWIRGRWSTSLVMTAVALTMTSLDPIMNWSPYASYNPTLLHLPETWWWVQLAPTVEPLVVWFGYTYYWLIPAWIVLALYRRVLRPRSSKWVARRPMAAMALVAYPLCFAWDLGIELALTRTGLIAYTQVVPGISIYTGQSWQYPVLLNSGCMALAIFMAAPLMWRDDTGRTFGERVSSRFPVFRRLPNLGTYLITTAVMGGLFLTYLVVFGTVRATGVADGTAQPWPYPETRVYDPQGYYRQHGEPGPYMVGVFTGWERHAVEPQPR